MCGLGMGGRGHFSMVEWAGSRMSRNALHECFLALTLSKWEQLEQEAARTAAASSSGLAAVSGYSYDDDLDGV